MHFGFPLEDTGTHHSLSHEPIFLTSGGKEASLGGGLARSGELQWGCRFLTTTLEIVLVPDEVLLPCLDGT